MFCRPTRLAFDAEDPAQAELGRGTLESKLGAFARATHPMGKPREPFRVPGKCRRHESR